MSLGARCGAIYNHGCVMGDRCERSYGHAGDHGSEVLDSLMTDPVPSTAVDLEAMRKIGQQLDPEGMHNSLVKEVARLNALLVERETLFKSQVEATDAVYLEIYEAKRDLARAQAVIEAGRREVARHVSKTFAVGEDRYCAGCSGNAAQWPCDAEPLRAALAAWDAAHQQPEGQK